MDYVYVTPQANGYFQAGYGYDPILGSSFTQSYLLGGANTVAPSGGGGSVASGGIGNIGSALGNIFAGVGTGLHNLLSGQQGIFPMGTFVPQGAVGYGGIAPAVAAPVNMGAILLIAGGALLFLKRK